MSDNDALRAANVARARQLIASIGERAAMAEARRFGRSAPAKPLAPMQELEAFAARTAGVPMRFSASLRKALNLPVETTEGERE